MDTGEIHRGGQAHANGHSNGNATITKVTIGVLTALTIGAIFGGVNAWSDARVLASDLAAHKEVEKQRLDELGRSLAEMRVEVKSELRDLRQAVERRK